MKKILQYVFIGFIVFSGIFAPLSIPSETTSISISETFAQEEGEELDSGIATTQEATNTNEGTITQEDSPIGYLGCKWNEFGCHMVNFLHWIFIIVGNWLVGLSAVFMDFFLNHTLQSSSYRDAGFIEQGWEILRDVTNLVFIFALLLAAFKLVLGIGASDAKRRVLHTILIALVINFSLFISYAVIDVSNIFAHVFYNKIEQSDTTFKSISIANGDGVFELEDINKKSASLAIAKKINPQRLLSYAGEINKARRALIIVMGGVINGALIFTFLSVAFLFLGRTIGLWFSAILAPLAFASITVPAMEKWSYVGFSSWLNSLLKASFMAPVFIFFLYLAVQFMNVGINVTSNSESLLDIILAIVIHMAAIVILIVYAKRIANKMAGDFAGVVSNIVTKGAIAIGGVGLAAATGGAALGLRSTVGKRAYNELNSQEFKDKVARGDKGALARKAKLEKRASGSFDFTKSRFGKMTTAVAGSAGLKMKQPSWAKIGGEGKGGYDKVRKDEVKEANKLFKWLTDGAGKDKKDKKDKEGELGQKQAQLNNNNKEREKIVEKIENIKENKENWSEDIKNKKLAQEEEKLQKHDQEKSPENKKLNEEITELKDVISSLGDKIKRKEGRKDQFVESMKKEVSSKKFQFGSEKGKNRAIETGAVAGTVALATIFPPSLFATVPALITGGIIKTMQSNIKSNRKKRVIAQDVDSSQGPKPIDNKDILDAIKKMNEDK